MTPIVSPKNPTVRHAHALLTQHRIRKKSGETVIEGVHLLEALLAKQNTSSISIKQVLLSQSALTHPEVEKLLPLLPSRALLVLDDKLYKEIRTLGDGVDVMAVIDTPKPDFTALGDYAGDCVILDGLQDAGNIGTLLRTACAVGIQTIITTPNTASLWSPKVLRASMGANFSLAIFEQCSFADITATLKTPLYATSSHTDKVIYEHDLTRPMAWVLGHEGQGVSDDFLRLATPIALPQPGGQESLNVGVAGSVCFYEMLRQRSYA
ncbi:RNA methyltransferase [Moraxella caviae]|uniref:23S rRNA (Guanosine-2'-O-)-methyltransferase RlmB n=1 Tax=Moraxella caviae TaxID=34060 RepID=A0A1S9ZXR8_9GAMM|nr:RNA methyltransferase [Moraxella caviae]OOR88265.1 RNA methyltransferase [Moraxella caviae]STZ13899.1 23S rRNA (guanosine-2'-O-)-methyltransferase RlmB [Moraxella caviae]